MPVRCPDCGSDEVGTKERLTGTALVEGYDAETGEFVYSGETIVDWDGSETQRTPDGQTLLYCRACCAQFASLTYPARPVGRAPRYAPPAPADFGRRTTDQ